MLKRILKICSLVILAVGIPIGAFFLRSHFIDNGRLAIRGGRLVAVPDVGYKFDSWSNGEENADAPFFKNLFAKPRFVIERLDFPAIVIETEGNKKIKSKEEYLDCTVTLLSDENNSFESEKARIKGRGNSTFGLDKKPYKIKFDEKIPMLGEGAAKEWTLIANHMDYSLMRNYIAYTLGDTLGLEYTTSCHFVDVYVNGEYMGVYLLCEQIEVKKHRVEIEDSLDTEETGYLLELDARAPDEGREGRDYFYSLAGTLPYAIKSPDTEDELFTSERVEYIKSYLDASYGALLGNDYSEVCRYLDIDTFVDGYILDELLKTTDVGFSSFYLYKDAGGKLSRGPIWDYDLAIGNSIQPNAKSPKSIYAGEVNPWYSRLLSFPEFREAVAKRLSEKKAEIEKTLDDAYLFAEKFERSFERNFDKWDDLLGNYCFEDITSREICTIETLDGQIEYLKSWLSLSLEFLTEQFPEN